jgi:hypothetical protein
MEEPAIFNNSISFIGLDLGEKYSYITIQLDGMLRTNLRKDVSFVKALNAMGAFSGEIINRKNIGKSVDELVVMWNEAHPDDPVE